MGTDDQPGPQTGHRHAAGGQHALNLEAAGQVAGKLCVVRNNASEIEDLFHSGPRGRPGEVVRQNKIHVLEPRLGQAGRQHGMDEINRVIDTLEGTFGLQERKQIALLPAYARQLDGRCAPQGEDVERVGELRQQSGPDKTRCSGHGDNRTFALIRHTAIKHAPAAGASPGVSWTASSASRGSRGGPFPRRMAPAERRAWPLRSSSAC